MLDWIIMLDPKSLIIGALISALFALWLDFFIKQPELKISGGGSGSNADGTIQNNITLVNKVGWFGVSIPETRIVGIRLHPRIHFGLPFEKNPARDCRASLFIKETDECVGQLWWRSDDNCVESVKTIRSGDSATLNIFARINDKSCEYFPYQPKSIDNSETNIPEKQTYFKGKKDFYIRINYSYNKVFIHDLNISQTFNGLLYLNNKGGSSLF